MAGPKQSKRLSSYHRKYNWWDDFPFAIIIVITILVFIIVSPLLFNGQEISDFNLGLIIGISSSMGQ